MENANNATVNTDAATANTGNAGNLPDNVKTDANTNDTGNTDGLPDNVNTDAATDVKTDAKKESAAPDQDGIDGDNAAISDWSKVNIEFPEGIEVDPNALESFGKTAIEIGLNKKQAQALAKWQADQIAANRTAWLNSQEKELKSAWGAKAAINQQKILAMISLIDRQNGNDDFSKAIGDSGAANHAGLLKGLLSLAEALGEDRLGAQTQGKAPDKPETALDGIKAAFAEARRGK